jgi:hypothetical protein
MNDRIVRKRAADAKSSANAVPVRQAAGAPKKARLAAKPAAKPTAKPTAKPAAKPAPAAEPAAKPKHKLVRDSFTIPKAEYAVLDALKLRAAALARPVKKSELLRAGISALNGMSDKAFLAAMNGVPSLKTGRPSSTPAAAPAAPRAK